MLPRILSAIPCLSLLRQALSSLLLTPSVCLSAAFFALLTPFQLSANEDSNNRATQLDFNRIEQAAARLPRLHSLLIHQHGELVYEQYFNGRDATQADNMKSASKSVISALIGIALERGDIASLDQPIADYFPELKESDSPAKRAITIENLLTMEAGLASTSNRNYGRWAMSDNWVQFALEQPMVGELGEDMIYSTGSTHVLSAIIERASGMSTLAYARQYLTNPMGINITYWSQDPQGTYFGGNNMEMRPRDMLKFGQLYLNGGEWNGQQLLSPEWTELSHRPHANSPRGQGRHYGYGWWLRELADMQVPLAWGYGGQLIFVVEPLDLIVVATADSQPGNGRSRHLRAIYDLVETHILAVSTRH